MLTSKRIQVSDARKATRLEWARLIKKYITEEPWATNYRISGFVGCGPKVVEQFRREQEKQNA